MVVGLVLVGALVFLVVKGLSSALNFYLPADQAMAQRATLGTPDLQSRGGGRAGLDPFDPERGGLRGHLGIDPARRWCNTGSPPQLFQPDIPVIAVGHFSGTTFVSDQILVKHSSNYIAAHPGRVTAPNGSKR